MLEKVFAELGAELFEVKNLLLAEVRIKEFGDKENQDVAKWNSVSTDALPELLFYADGKQSKRYGAEFTLDALKLFLRHSTGAALPLPGCVAQLDPLAAEFAAADGAKARRVILDRADAVAVQIEDERIKSQLIASAMKKAGKKSSPAGGGDAGPPKKIASPQTSPILGRRRTGGGGGGGGPMTSLQLVPDRTGLQPSAPDQLKEMFAQSFHLVKHDLIHRIRGPVIIFMHPTEEKYAWNTFLGKVVMIRTVVIPVGIALFIVGIIQLEVGICGIGRFIYFV